MARETGMPTPIFDELLREMTSRAEALAAQSQPAKQDDETGPEPEAEPLRTARRRHRAE